jgi:hypothetical protein
MENDATRCHLKQTITDDTSAIETNENIVSTKTALCMILLLHLSATAPSIEQQQLDRYLKW